MSMRTVQDLSSGGEGGGVVQFVLSLSDMHAAWQSHSLARGFGGMFPR